MSDELPAACSSSSSLITDHSSLPFPPRPPRHPPAPAAPATPPAAAITAVVAAIDARGAARAQRVLQLLPLTRAEDGALRCQHADLLVEERVADGAKA